jgi:hypothetical protein
MGASLGREKGETHCPFIERGREEEESVRERERWPAVLQGPLMAMAVSPWHQWCERNGGGETDASSSSIMQGGERAQGRRLGRGLAGLGAGSAGTGCLACVRSSRSLGARRVGTWPGSALGVASSARLLGVVSWPRVQVGSAGLGLGVGLGTCSESCSTGAGHRFPAASCPPVRA